MKLHHQRSNPGSGFKYAVLAALAVGVAACGGPRSWDDADDGDPTDGDTTSADAETEMTADESSSDTSRGPGPGADAGMQVFLLFGQSNMEGVPDPEAEDLVENERVQVLGYDSGCLGRQWNEWAVAKPPLHRCWTGVGPGDSFGKAMAEAWPDATIGLVPAAISGVDIDFFRKEVVSSRRDEFEIPPDDELDGAYEMLLERAQLAQESGTIRGILFHQGESDTGQSAWVGKVAEIVADLRADLGLGEDVPFIAGELMYSGCCSSHNRIISRLPDEIPNAHVVSADGLGAHDEYHFDLEGMRTLGLRYADAMLDALDE